MLRQAYTMNYEPTLQEKPVVYSPEQVIHLEEGFRESNRIYETRLLLLMQASYEARSADAREFILQGVGRRWRILHNCIKNVFAIFPLDRVASLDFDESAQLCISLHAYFINLFGALDNLAWTLVSERQANIPRRSIGLYAQRTQAIMSADLRNYLNSSPIDDWHDDHLKEFRDSLAHRIPLYVPPGVDRDGREFALPAFAGSINDNKAMILHGQVIADFNTVAQIIDTFFEHEFGIVVPG